MGSSGSKDPGGVALIAYDFDCTISSVHIYHALNKFAKAGSGTRSEKQCAQLEATQDDRVIEWFGSSARLQRLRTHFKLLSENKCQLYIISHGYETVIAKALKRVGLE